MDNEDKVASVDEPNDVPRVENVCKEMGFVMHADQSSNSRYGNILYLPVII